MPSIRIQRAADGERDHPIFTELARRMESVRQRAFEMFAARGGEEGHDLDDWIAAEHEVLGWPAAELKEANGAFQVVRAPTRANSVISFRQHRRSSTNCEPSSQRTGHGRRRPGRTWSTSAMSRRRRVPRRCWYRKIRRSGASQS